MSNKNEKEERTTATITTLQKAGYEFKLNTLTDSLEVNGESMTDVTEYVMRSELKYLGTDITKDELLVDLYGYAKQRAYNPIREYFDTLPKWDEVDHIGALAKHFTDSHEPIVYASGESRTVIHAMLRRWLIGAVQRVHDYKAQNPVLVLAGKQGIGKSFFADWICPLSAHFYRGSIDPDAFETNLFLTQNLIWEIDEIGATTRKRDVSALKASLTKGMIEYRPKYGRYTIKKPVMASFIGTVNNDGIGFLRDLTGNRRFASVELESIDRDYTNLDKNLIWAQALHLYSTGETCTYSAEEVEVQTANNEENTYMPTVNEWLDDVFDLDPKETNWSMKSSDMCEILRQAGYNASPKIIIDELSQCLAKRGHKKMGKPLTWRGVKQNSKTRIVTFVKDK